MNNGLVYTSAQGIKKLIIRALLIFCLGMTLATTFVIFSPVPVSAAPSSATTVRHDRRPDRERPVSTSQSRGGFSQGSSSSHSRPRLVRR
jgi:hypothetical protein